MAVVVVAGWHQRFETVAARHTPNPPTSAGPAFWAGFFGGSVAPVASPASYDARGESLWLSGNQGEGGLRLLANPHVSVAVAGSCGGVLLESCPNTLIRRDFDLPFPWSLGCWRRNTRVQALGSKVGRFLGQPNLATPSLQSRLLNSLNKSHPQP